MPAGGIRPAFTCVESLGSAAWAAWWSGYRIVLGQGVGLTSEGEDEVGGRRQGELVTQGDSGGTAVGNAAGVRDGEGGSMEVALETADVVPGVTRLDRKRPSGLLGHRGGSG